MFSFRWAVPASFLLLTGCVVGPDHEPPTTPLPAKFGERAGATSNGAVEHVAWWTTFRDPKLNDLVAIGLRENLNIQQAVERINAAEANVTVAGAGSLPSLGVSASRTTSGQAGELRQTPTRTTTGGSISASWLIDLFGEYRRSKESAAASLDAAYATADIQRLVYLQDLVSSYIDARYYQERIALSKANLRSRRETFDLTKFQLEAGAASRLDVVQSESLVRATQAEIPVLEINFNVAVHHISTLLGQPASVVIADLQRGASQPIARAKVNAGVPADLIRNRPDIRRAERDLAAAVANIGVAEAQLYPSITLSGSISPSYIKQGGVGGYLSPWSFGPTLNLPIFDGGRIRANIDITKSNAKTQYLAWKLTVLNAIEEVENALSAVSRDARTVEALRAQVKVTQEALNLATASYKDGASSLLDTLDAQRSVSTAQASLAQAVQQMARDYVALNVAIGSGYAFDSAPKPVGKGS